MSAPPPKPIPGKKRGLERLPVALYTAVVRLLRKASMSEELTPTQETMSTRHDMMAGLPLVAYLCVCVCVCVRAYVCVCVCVCVCV